ncbi:thiamine pyrophosphate-dependent dehydrogenase E1 component subunit alpha [[Mycoplasma] testudinis]|uniref:thiamine pyrophosphate-dependent dehydrogenase E1 component subunit alpha n=1 Tax=[Mycoplasma] testudinis TaxID=33924 RepID=UPI0004884B0F|nr:thiamine pyrophosphate-dependent dehydrogenase E1 component subunit alpha [[Mycoplasma] testudinis]
MSILVKSKIPESFFQVLDIDGKLVDGYTPNLSVEKVLEAYKFMNISRQKDKKMLNWQRSGKMLNFAPNLGEEALQAAVALAMHKEDWLVPAFRSDCLMNMRGVPLHTLMLYWAGNELGNVFPEGVNVLPINITIGAQISHNAGMGYALKYQGKKNASVSFIGDGGTAEGEFYEAINMAAIHKWNSLFCINSNGFAISTRPHNESAVSDISSKAIAFDIPRARVDGNDLFASYDAARDALAYVRSGMGPVILEFVTFRQGPHTTSDDPTIYRTKEELAEGMKKDPIDRLRKWLIANAHWDDAKEEAMQKEIADLVEAEYAICAANMGHVSIDDIFDSQYAKITPELAKQKAIAKKYFE